MIKLPKAHDNHNNCSNFTVDNHNINNGVDKEKKKKEFVKDEFLKKLENQMIKQEKNPYKYIFYTGLKDVLKVHPIYNFSDTTWYYWCWYCSESINSNTTSNVQFGWVRSEPCHLKELRIPCHILFCNEKCAEKYGRILPAIEDIRKFYGNEVPDCYYFKISYIYDDSPDIRKCLIEYCHRAEIHNIHPYVHNFCSVHGWDVPRGGMSLNHLSCNNK